MSNSSSVTFLAQTKSRKSKSKGKGGGKRKLRKSSEKHIEARDEELPWPPPDDSAISIYNQLLSSNFKKLTSLGPTNFLSATNAHRITRNNNNNAVMMNPVENMPNPRIDQSFSSRGGGGGVQDKKNLEKYFGSNGFHHAPPLPPRCSPLQQSASNSMNLACCSTIMPVAPASSEDVCTLFQNSCQIGSTGKRGQLPAIGVFWDIENCSIPKGRSALVAVQKIRDRFFPGHIEAEFVCVCDIRKESPGVIQELNDAQVSVVHVSGNSKNAADDKLRQSMRRFADIYSGHYACTSSPFPATVILISGDINFSSDLSDLRHRKKLYVVLLGNRHTPDALLLCAHEQYDFHSFLGNLPARPMNRESIDPIQNIPLKGGLLAQDVLVCDLPHSNSKTQTAIKNRLRKLSENCGGKVITLQGGFALLRFPNKEAAMRATKRMNGEDVLGSKIRVIYSSQMEFRSPADSGGGGGGMMVENPTTPARNPRIRELSQSTTPGQNQSLLMPTSSPAGQSPSPSSSSWRPTWKNRPSPSVDSFNNGPSPFKNRHPSSVADTTSYLGGAPSPSTIVVASPSSIIRPETLKKEVASLLQDVPGASLPLFKFREMFEKRYQRSVSSSDLYRLRDVVAISESPNSGGYSLGRTISLSNDWKAKDKNVSLYCSTHPPKKVTNKSRTGWAEKEAEILLPNVMIELKLLTTRVNSLLASHNGMVPLISFLDCYEAEFEKMEIVESGGGVPLEHLLACIQGVDITFAENGMKRIQFGEKHPMDNGILAQPSATQLAQFGREMVDLLKTFPRCSLAFSKLIPAYHHHFGRQCRVADYGHINLQSLLQTIPHVIQIMGFAQNRILTLSHKAQMKRFATDLLRVLKANGGVKKQIKVNEFSQGFSQLFPNRQFLPEDYGLCYFSDLITELVENSTLVALVKDEDGNQMLAVPKREQTPQEIHRTRIFASEVIELFRHSIRYEMPFSKFIPSYHHHFGKQCRVSNYGFSKLAELFEAISDTVICVPPPGPASDYTTDDKMIRLVPQEQVKVVGEQLRKLIETHTNAGKHVRLSELDELFIDEHGFQLRPEMCDADNIEDLAINKLASYIKVDNGYVTFVDQNEVRCLMQDIIEILKEDETENYRMDLDQFLKRFEESYEVPLTLETITGQLNNMLVLSPAISTAAGGESTDENHASNGKISRTIELSPLRIFALEISQILEDVGSSIMVSNVDAVYLQKYGRPLRPAQMGYTSLVALLEAIPDVVQVLGKHRAKRVCLLGMDPHISGEGSSSFEELPYNNNNNRSYSNSNLNRSTSSRNGDYGTPPQSSGYNKDIIRMNHNNNNYNARCHSAEQFRPYPNHNHHLKMGETGRWSSESPTKRHNRAPPPPPLYLPGTPAFTPRGGGGQGGRGGGPADVFTFDHHQRPPQLSPLVYDMWMREPLSPGSPPISPPVVWTYHPIVYPPNTPPANTANIMVPTFSFNGNWSPATTYLERVPQHHSQNNGVVEYTFSEQPTRLMHGMERLGLEGRNEA